MRSSVKVTVSFQLTAAININSAQSTGIFNKKFIPLNADVVVDRWILLSIIISERSNLINPK